MSPDGWIVVHLSHEGSREEGEDGMLGLLGLCSMLREEHPRRCRGAVCEPLSLLWAKLPLSTRPGKSLLWPGVGRAAQPLRLASPGA